MMRDRPTPEEAAEWYQRQPWYVVDVLDWIGTRYWQDVPSELMSTLCAHYERSVEFAGRLDDIINGEYRDKDA